MAPLSLRALALLGLTGAAAAVTLSVSNTGGNATNPYTYGIMFEDISHSGDGGLYAELIQNRAFQNGTLDFWAAVGGASIALDTSTPLSQALPHSIKVSGGTGSVGIKNGGYWGIDVKKCNKYTGSFYSYGAYSGRFIASLVSNDTNKALATTTIKSKSVAGKWTQHTFELRPAKDAPNVANTFVLQYSAAQGTELKFNLISLFPPTYNNRPNGMRPELMEKLKALNPSYIRAPGGNNIEGNSAGNYWNWSNTIGPLTDRPGRMGTWSYYNTDGLGLVEYMHWAEDLGMEVVLAVPSGLALNGEVVSKADLAPLVQDVLNELEFLMGDITTPYGALRAKLGYPKPWNIKYVEVGNEDHLWGGLSSYESYRLQLLYDAIHAKYPDIFIFSSTAEFMYKQSGRDYHEYTRPDFFVSQFGMFDNWSAGNNIMIGEYASIQNNTGKLEDTDWNAPKNDWSTWIGSVSEAVFLLGAERNADRIWGASFAPLLQNLNDYQWTPDLISFTADPADTTVSTSYPVIELLSGTRISHTLPAKTVDGDFGPAYWVAGRDASQYILKAAVYNSTGDVPFSVGFEGLRPGASAQLTVLTAPDGPFAKNTPQNKNSVLSKTQRLTAGRDGSIKFSLPNLSVAVLTAKC